MLWSTLMLPLDAARQNPFAQGLMRDQVCIVTGGGTGIGRATAAALLDLGARVAIGSRDPAHYETAARQLASRGEVLGLPLDIREPDQVQRFVDAVLQRFDRVDVLVNNAGGQFPSPAANISARGFDAVVRNNLHGTFHVTREVATRAMIPARRGSIVNVLLNVARGFPGMAHAAAARAGVENLTQSLAIEWAEFDVRVNAIAPGIIQSSGLSRYSPEFTTAAVRRTPQKRIGTVEEVAHAIVFLASSATSFMTGTTLRLDGGAALWGDRWSIPDREPPR